MEEKRLRKLAGILLKESVETDAKSIVKSIITLGKVHPDRTSQGELAFVLEDLVQNKEIKKSELTKLASLLDFINDMSKSAVSGKPDKRGK
jgi:predicted secreted Zn-dependent protease